MRQGAEEQRAEYSLEILKGGTAWHDGKGVWKGSQRSPPETTKRPVCEKYQGANLRYGFNSAESKES